MQLHCEIEELKVERLTAKGWRQDEIERELGFRRERFANIQREKFALEDEHMERTGQQPRGKDQRNFTAPESKIMKKGSGFEQCYNAQAAVDKRNQIIVAAYVAQACNDKQQLETLVERTVAQTGSLPDRGLADNGYFSEAVTESLKKRYGSTEWLISLGRLSSRSTSTAAPKGRIPHDISVADLMRRKLSTKAGKAAYAQREAIVEPAFGQIKEANLEFRRFSFRGLNKVQDEWLLVCAAHNFLKVIRKRQSRRHGFKIASYSLHLFPRDVSFLTPAHKRSAPIPVHLVAKKIQGGVITGYTIVLVVSGNHLVQPFSDRLKWFVHALLKLVFHCFHFRIRLLSDCFPHKRKISAPCFAANMRKT